MYYDDGSMMMGLIFSLVIAAGLGLIPANIAKKKGRSFGLWWFYGWMLFIVALIHSLLMKDNNLQHEHHDNPQNYAANINSSADEIKKYKELLDQGILTEEEFQLKKEQILRLK